MFVTLPTESGKSLYYAIFAFDDMYSHVDSIALIVSSLNALMKDQVSPFNSCNFDGDLAPHMVLLLPYKAIQQLFYSAQLLLSYRTHTHTALSISLINQSGVYVQSMHVHMLHLAFRH